MKNVVTIALLVSAFTATAQSPVKVASQKLGYLAGSSFTVLLPMIAGGLLVYGLNRAIKRRRAFNLQK